MCHAGVPRGWAARVGRAGRAAKKQLARGAGPSWDQAAEAVGARY